MWSAMAGPTIYKKARTEKAKARTEKHGKQVIGASPPAGAVVPPIRSSGAGAVVIGVDERDEADASEQHGVLPSMDVDGYEDHFDGRPAAGDEPEPVFRGEGEKRDEPVFRGEGEKRDEPVFLGELVKLGRSAGNEPDKLDEPVFLGEGEKRGRSAGNEDKPDEDKPSEDKSSEDKPYEDGSRKNGDELFEQHGGFGQHGRSEIFEQDGGCERDEVHADGTPAGGDERDHGEEERDNAGYAVTK